MRYLGLIFGTLIVSVKSLDHPEVSSLSNATSVGRILHSEHAPFKPLACNIPECNKGTTTWTAEKYDTLRRVVIPCGLCVDMDYIGEADQTLALPYGLEVQGTLRFSNNYHLAIETPFVIVQGSLKMVALRKVTDKPSIQIKLTGTKEVSFMPIDVNKDNCGQGVPCKVGVQPIVAAGGQMDLRGIGQNCKTWVNLIDVVAVDSVVEPFTFQYERPATLDPEHENVICRKYDPYVSDTFDAKSTPSRWTGGYGALYDWSRGFLTISDRRDTLEHSPTLDMLPFQDCLMAGETYLFSARVRLRHDSLKMGTSTHCKENGDDCVSLQYTIDYPNRRVGSRKGREFPSDEFRYGRWEDFYATFTFEEDEIRENSIYQLLRLSGSVLDAEIDVDDVTFGLVDPSLFPNPENVCGGNLIMNGDAEASPIHPFPVKASNGRLRVFSFFNGNQVFRLSGRSDDMDAIQTELAAPQCIVARSQYTVRARIRFVSNTLVASRMMVRIMLINGASTFIQAADCPKTGKAWNDCTGQFTVLEDYDPNDVESVRVYFVTEEAPRVTMDVDDWHFEVSRPAKSGIVVPSEGVKECWGQGAEIALTSHTLDRNDAQVRKLVSQPVDLGDGTVRLELDDSIIFPVTKVQDENFAVEVLLLNRNIRFEGGNHESNKGAHFMVMMTPDVNQLVRGVEFRRFGRLGELGRYPIHMHMCESTQSRIEQNLVLDSHQRCIVIHGTHNTTVKENVAFRTKGHCFMLEDGGEQDNTFEANLGALTSAASRIVRPGETDKTNPSTFWVSNPKNNFIGNIAAGSEGNGFWFELQTSVKPPSSFYDWAKDVNPKFLQLLTFRDNVAHSNYRFGFRTYPHGFVPPTVGELENIRSYKNRLDGLFIRNTENLHIKGGFFADNRKSISMELAQNILIEGSSVIGRTDRFKEIVDAEKEILNHDLYMVGVELHVRTDDTLEMGATIKNVSFSGMHQHFATKARLFDLNVERTRDWDGIFSFWSLLEDISVDDLSITVPFDMQGPTQADHSAVYLVDRDSSLKPPGSSASASSVIIADSEDVKAFCDLDTLCHRSRLSATWYCRDTCLRTVIFSVDPTAIGNAKLQILDKNDSSRSFSYTGGFPTEYLNNGKPDPLANSDWDKYVSFAAALPRGSYLARFVRGDGSVVWPSFVETTWGPSLCQGGASPNNVQLVTPNIPAFQCKELIRNGDMETGSTVPWLHSFGSGSAVESGEGRNGSKALGDLYQSHLFGGMGQYIDTRCLTKGAIYDIRVWVRLERRNGEDFGCGRADCGPKLKVRTMTPNDTDGPTAPLERVIRPLATRFDGVLQPDWNLLEARVTVDNEWEQASSVFIYVDRGRTGVRLFLDDFSMRRVN